MSILEDVHSIKTLSLSLSGSARGIILQDVFI